MVDVQWYENIETFLSNVSFITLFVSLLAYWIEVSGFLVNPSADQKKFNATSETFIDSSKTSSLNFSVSVLSKKQTENLFETAGTPLETRSFNSVQTVRNESSTKGFFTALKIGQISILTSNVFLFLFLSLRWSESGHFPLSNLYESLVFLGWSLTFFHLILEKMVPTKLNWIGAITSPIGFFILAFANFSLPKEMQHASALVPALQSNWLMMHVTVMILSYAALMFGSLLSMGFLILTYSISSAQYDAEIKKQKFGGFHSKPFSKIDWALILDNLSYRMLGIGFPLLTIGILSGAVWANEAWGSYWSWDPKETWALLTWFVFAIYLHTRFTKNWQGKKPAMIASFGFFVVWVCYLGVNLLGEGLHSYGWIQS